MNYLTLKTKESRIVKIDFTLDYEPTVTISSVTWKLTCGKNLICIDSEILTGNTAQAKICANGVGCAIIEVMVELSNQEKCIKNIKVNIVEPVC